MPVRTAGPAFTCNVDVLYHNRLERQLLALLQGRPPRHGLDLPLIWSMSPTILYDLIKTKRMSPLTIKYEDALIPDHFWDIETGGGERRVVSSDGDDEDEEGEETDLKLESAAMMQVRNAINRLALDGEDNGADDQDDMPSAKDRWNVLRAGVSHPTLPSVKVLLDNVDGKVGDSQQVPHRIWNIVMEAILPTDARHIPSDGMTHFTEHYGILSEEVNSLSQKHRLKDAMVVKCIQIVIDRVCRNEVIGPFQGIPGVERPKHWVATAVCNIASEEMLVALFVNVSSVLDI